MNKLLSGAWDEYVAALEQGTVRELESKYQSLISGVVDDVVRDPELPRGPALD